MIKSYKIVIIIQCIILLIFSFVFNEVYNEDIQLIPMIQLLIIGFSPLILLAISIIIQRLIVAVIHSDSTNDEVNKEAPIDKFWKNAFFINVIFGALTFLCSIISSVLKLEVGVVSSDYIYRFFISLDILMISSLIISLVLRIKDSVIEITKFLGFLMLFISILIFSFSLYLAVLNVVTIRSNSGDGIIGTLNSVSETEEVATDVEHESEGEGEGEESESDYYGFNEMSFPEVNINGYFKELFEDSSYDNTKTEDLTKNFLSDFLVLEKDQSFTGIRIAIERGFAYDEEIKKVDEKIRRNPEAIREAFDSYNTLLYAFLSNKIYFDSNLNLIVDALIKTHEDIYETENPHERLTKIYKIMIFGAQKEFPNYYYNEIKPYASENVLSLVSKNAETSSEKDNSNAEYASQLNTVWIYSFWARRHKEKNEDVVFEILKEIKEHYNED